MDFTIQKRIAHLLTFFILISAMSNVNAFVFQNSKTSNAAEHAHHIGMNMENNDDSTQSSCCSSCEIPNACESISCHTFNAFISSSITLQISNVDISHQLYNVIDVAKTSPPLIYRPPKNLI